MCLFPLLLVIKFGIFLWYYCSYLTFYTKFGSPFSFLKIVCLVFYISLKIIYAFSIQQRTSQLSQHRGITWGDVKISEYKRWHSDPIPAIELTDRIMLAGNMKSLRWFYFSFNGFNVKTQMRTMQVNYLTDTPLFFPTCFLWTPESPLGFCMPVPQKRESKDAAADSTACCTTHKWKTLNKRQSATTFRASGAQ